MMTMIAGRSAGRPAGRPLDCSRPFYDRLRSRQDPIGGASFARTIGPDSTGFIIETLLCFPSSSLHGVWTSLSRDQIICLISILILIDSILPTCRIAHSTTTTTTTTKATASRFSERHRQFRSAKSKSIENPIATPSSVKIEKTLAE